jgi:hypothetical protein
MNYPPLNTDCPCAGIRRARSSSARERRVMTWRYLVLLVATVPGAHALRTQPLLSRRAAVASGAALCIPALAPSPVRAAATARVTTWPGLEYLEPIYELKLSLDALNAVAGDPSRWPALQRRMDKFFSGGLLSERWVRFRHSTTSHRPASLPNTSFLMCTCARVVLCGACRAVSEPDQVRRFRQLRYLRQASAKGSD